MNTAAPWHTPQWGWSYTGILFIVQHLFFLVFFFKCILPLQCLECHLKKKKKPFYSTCAIVLSGEEWCSVLASVSDSGCFLKTWWIQKKSNGGTIAVSEKVCSFSGRVTVILWPLTAASCQYRKRKCRDPSSDWPRLQRESIHRCLQGQRVNRLHISGVCCHTSKGRALNWHDSLQWRGFEAPRLCLGFKSINFSLR